MKRTYFYSQRGTSHIKNEIVNQDAAYSMSQNGVEVLALADGVGSCRHADVGAKFVVRYMCAYACSDFEGLARMSKVDLRDLIMQGFALSCGSVYNYREALSTLLLVAKKGNQLLVIQIGDGKIILVAKGTSSQVFPDDGLPLNQSYTWASEPACFCKTILDTSRMIAEYMVLCTDGVYKPDRAPVEFNKGFSYLNEAFVLELYKREDEEGFQSFIQTVVTASNGHEYDFDDKTAGLMLLR